MNKTTLPLIVCYFNPLNAELNPFCHLLTLLGAHPILHISRLRVNPVLLFHLLFTVGVFPNYVGILVVLTQHGTSY